MYMYVCMYVCTYVYVCMYYMYVFRQLSVFNVNLVVLDGVQTKCHQKNARGKCHQHWNLFQLKVSVITLH